MKFIHTSDWHIGRQFHNVSLLEDQQHVLNQIIDYIKQESVDALIIAGDIYDRAIPPVAAVELMDDLFNQICAEMGVPVILISGNHDSPQRISFGSRQLENSGLHIMGELGNITKPVVLNNGSSTVHFYGIPYNDPEHVRDEYDTKVTNHNEAHVFLVDKIKSLFDKDVANVLISHCFIDGGEESESERPLSIGGADRVSTDHCVDFDYVALGHLHSPQFKGEKHIRYCGSILKYSFSEQSQNKGVTLVEIENNELKEFKHLPLKPLRNMRVIEGEIDKIIEQGKTDPHADDYLLIRLTDTHAILNAMGKLRDVYPNVLHLEKPGLMTSTDNQVNIQDNLKLSEFDMFQEFYRQMSDNKLTDDQDEAIKNLINKLHQSGE